MKIGYLIGADAHAGAQPAGVPLESRGTMNFFPLSDDPQFGYLTIALGRAQRAFDALLFGED